MWSLSPVSRASLPEAGPTPVQLLPTRRLERPFPKLWQPEPSADIANRLPGIKVTPTAAPDQMHSSLPRSHGKRGALLLPLLLKLLTAPSPQCSSDVASAPAPRAFPAFTAGVRGRGAVSVLRLTLPPLHKALRGRHHHPRSALPRTPPSWRARKRVSAGFVLVPELPTQSIRCQPCWGSF